MIAVCVLPISRKTICYGSCDAGRTIHASYPQCNAAMQDIGKRLNLMGHRVGTSPHLIYGPGDIECHLGNDGKFYVLDFSRYMPPQPIQKGKPRGSFLYELLRPELVAQSPVPLSPDGFSSMQIEGQAEARQDIRACFSSLRGIVDEYVQCICTKKSDVRATGRASTGAGSSAKTEMEIEDTVLIRLHMMELLESEMHSRGINMRFLGWLRQTLPADPVDDSIRFVVLAECLARLWKKELRHLWRDTMENETIPSEEPFRRVSAHFLNIIVSGNAADYWKMDIRINLSRKFEGILIAEEMAPEFDFFAFVEEYLPSALLRFAKFVSLELRDGMLTSSKSGLLKAILEKSTNTFEFITSDIVTIGCRTKHL